jgi:hypothetical protein
MYAQELEEVKAILGKNADQHHKGVLFALEAVGKWLDQNANDCQTPPRGGASPGYLQHLYRLRAHGVTAYTVLCECAALYLFHHRYPDYIRDKRHLIHVIGLRVLRLCHHKGERFTGKMHREAGQAIYDRIGILLVTVAHTAEQIKYQKQELKRLLSTPLAMPESVGGVSSC